MNLKVKIFAFSLVALFAYTFGFFFLTFAPIGIQLSPGEETLSGDNSLTFSVILLVITAAMLLVIFFQKKGQNEK